MSTNVCTSFQCLLLLLPLHHPHTGEQCCQRKQSRSACSWPRRSRWGVQLFSRLPGGSRQGQKSSDLRPAELHSETSFVRNTFAWHRIASWICVLSALTAQEFSVSCVCVACVAVPEHICFVIYLQRCDFLSNREFNTFQPTTRAVHTVEVCHTLFDSRSL
jgi:hypothetical protein